ncbi:MAG: DUF89 family protein [Coriobacteriia bacterium]|nr:DUF89 family protein [Coriobacteriia bacterium]MBN2822294.1 DUF89 family protein [Coriobacteriia bacterium]
MDVAFECIPCTVKSCLRLLDEGCVSEDQREELLRLTLGFLAVADWAQSPPVLARELHAQLRKAAADADPYRKIKRRSNVAMLEHAGELRDELMHASDPFTMAVRLAIAGNVIDFGAQHLFDPVATIRRVLTADLAIDDIGRLREDMACAQTVLYVGDNAGEIVLDELFLETMAHNDVTFVVRGAPVINDATLADAELVGIPAHARVITTGDDSPGVVLERVSAEFQELFDRADVVISKGQGNLEGLWGAPRDIYFLLTVKCERIARLLGVTVGDFVVWKHEAAVL